MPKNDSVSTATTAVNPNAMELTGPVDDEFLSGTPDDSLGSHRDDDTTDSKTDTDAEDDGDEVPEDKIPARLKGKSLSQVYAEFAGLEREYSRQGNELGEHREMLRQTLDTILQSNNRATPEEPEEVTDEDLQSPEGVRKLVEREIAPVKARAATAEQKLLVVEFNERHPGFQQTVKTPEFQEFVKSSRYRASLLQKASNYDMDAADELFTAWEEKVAAAKADGTDEDEQEDPAVTKRRKLRQASTETGGAGKGAGGKGGKKVWKSVEIHRLYNNDREKYNEQIEEIKLAYREGRVK